MDNSEVVNSSLHPKAKVLYVIRYLSSVTHLSASIMSLPLLIFWCPSSIFYFLSSAP